MTSTPSHSIPHSQSTPIFPSSSPSTHRSTSSPILPTSSSTSSHTYHPHTHRSPSSGSSYHHPYLIQSTSSSLLSRSNSSPNHSLVSISRHRSSRSMSSLAGAVNASASASASDGEEERERRTSMEIASNDGLQSPVDKSGSVGRLKRSRPAPGFLAERAKKQEEEPDLPLNPKIWSPSELAQYLGFVLRTGGVDGNGPILPAPVIADIRSWVIRQQVNGRTFLRDASESWGLNCRPPPFLPVLQLISRRLRRTSLGVVPRPSSSTGSHGHGPSSILMEEDEGDHLDENGDMYNEDQDQVSRVRRLANAFDAIGSASESGDDEMTAAQSQGEEALVLLRAQITGDIVSSGSGSKPTPKSTSRQNSQPFPYYLSSKSSQTFSPSSPSSSLTNRCISFSPKPEHEPEPEVEDLVQDDEDDHISPAKSINLWTPQDEPVAFMPQVNLDILDHQEGNDPQQITGPRSHLASEASFGAPTPSLSRFSTDMLTNEIKGLRSDKNELDASTLRPDRTRIVPRPRIDAITHPCASEKIEEHFSKSANVDSDPDRTPSKHQNSKILSNASQLGGKDLLTNDSKDKIVEGDADDEGFGKRSTSPSKGLMIWEQTQSEDAIDQSKLTRKTITPRKKVGPELFEREEMKVVSTPSLSGSVKRRREKEREKEEEEEKEVFKERELMKEREEEMKIQIQQLMSKIKDLEQRLEGNRKEREKLVERVDDPLPKRVRELPAYLFLVGFGVGAVVVRVFMSKMMRA